MRHASLFSGIGGFDLAAEWMGWENVFQVEKDEFCQKVLEKNFPQTKRYGDIKEFDGTKYHGTIDILTGGFPCQPYSGAGKRKGDKDDRHLWPEMLRIIREVYPSYIVGENVSGLINWEQGIVFDQVLSDLEDSGYETQSFILPALSVDANHRRDRIWIIANARRELRTQSIFKGINAFEVPRKREEKKRGNDRKFLKMEPGLPPVPEQAWVDSSFTAACTYGISSGLDDAEHWTKQSLRGAGNAIVPQVAFEIFKAIETCTLTE